MNITYSVSWIIFIYLLLIVDSIDFKDISIFCIIFIIYVVFYLQKLVQKQSKFDVLIMSLSLFHSHGAA